MTKPAYQYEPVEAFGESLTTAKPWNNQALAMVERLNGRVAVSYTHLTLPTICSV